MGKDPYKYYRVEAHELLDDLTRLATELDQGAADKSLVAKLLRLAHTLKGASQVVKQASIAGMAHAIEDILCPFRETEGRIPKSSTTEALGLLDHLAAELALLGTAPEGNPINTVTRRISKSHSRLSELKWATWMLCSLIFRKRPFKLLLCGAKQRHCMI